MAIEDFIVREYIEMVWTVEKTEYRIHRRVLMAVVIGGRVQGRPSLGWLDGVKVALGSRGMTVEAARQCEKDREEWRVLVHMWMTEFHAAIFPWLLCLPDRPPTLWGLSPGEGWDAVLDLVGVDCERGVATENKDTGV